MSKQLVLFKLEGRKRESYYFHWGTDRPYHYHSMLACSANNPQPLFPSLHFFAQWPVLTCSSLKLGSWFGCWFSLPYFFSIAELAYIFQHTYSRICCFSCLNQLEEWFKAVYFPNFWQLHWWMKPVRKYLGSHSLVKPAINSEFFSQLQDSPLYPMPLEKHMNISAFIHWRAACSCAFFNTIRIILTCLA